MKNLCLSHSKLILFCTASQSYSSLGPQSLVHSGVHCCCSVTQLFATARTAARQASLSFTISWSLLKLMSTELVMPSNHLLLCHPLLLLPSIFPRIRVFSNDSALHIRWPKYWSFSFSISPSCEYSGLIILYCLLSLFFSCIFVLPCPGKAFP